MRKQLIAGAAALALATTMATSSTAFAGGGGGGGGGNGSGFDAFDGGEIHGSYAAMYGSGFAGHSRHGRRHFANGYGHGGFGAAGPAQYPGYCSPYYGDYGYCGSDYIIGW